MAILVWLNNTIERQIYIKTFYIKILTTQYINQKVNSTTFCITTADRPAETSILFYQRFGRQETHRNTQRIVGRC